MPGPPPLPLRTDRLVLRPYTMADLEPTLDYYRDPEVSRFLLTEPFDLEDAREAVEKRCRRTQPTNPGDALALVVEHDGRVVGDVVLILVGEQTSIGEIGWCFHPDVAGRGFATEAAAALVDLAFRHYDLHRVKAQLDARNTASARLCERLEMVEEAHLRQDWWSKGEWTDTLIFGILADEWTAR